MKVILVGMGMGAPGLLTRDAHDALTRADVVIGAERLVAGLPAEYAGARVVETRPERIADLLTSYPSDSLVCVALSGDVGFYSGARRLLAFLHEYETEILCGVSTPQYLAARLGRPWQGFRLVSAHGVDCDVLAEVLNHPETLFLTGGAVTAGDIVERLCLSGLEGARVTVGENLSYPDERIVTDTAARLLGRAFADLSAVLVENNHRFVREAVVPGIEDEAFIRGDAPMTKREVRTLALSLLRLRSDDIVYDVGSGTGSVAVEAALLARRGRVFAVERKPDAVRLIEANKERFAVGNLFPVTGTAPEALAGLPPSDAVFIGGGGNTVRDIITTVKELNAEVRVVASAITLETVTLALDAMRDLGLAKVEAVQMAASRIVRRGERHMLTALNPIFLVSGGGKNA